MFRRPSGNRRTPRKWRPENAQPLDRPRANSQHHRDTEERSGSAIRLGNHRIVSTEREDEVLRVLADMDVQAHWEKVYTQKAPNEVSWYRPHLEVSLALIEKAAAGFSASIIDVGGGESTLVDDLLARGYTDITVLDISQTAIDGSRQRLGGASEQIHWRVADITQVELEPAAYDIWHDRAVFHFLTAAPDRTAYVRQVARAVRAGGHVIVSSFGPEGPPNCSGLEVVRYDAGSLHKEFGPRFRLITSSRELHETPSGTTQQFLYCYCVVE
jgi:SAM-dependent methyltransferase